jgi:transcriptional regulator with XRE-family HTH domain
MQTHAMHSAQSLAPAGNTRLRDARLRRQLAQAALAVVAGVSPSLVVAVERYGHQPRPETRARLARALGVSEGTLWPPGETRGHEARPT